MATLKVIRNPKDRNRVGETIVVIAETGEPLTGIQSIIMDDKRPTPVLTLSTVDFCMEYDTREKTTSPKPNPPDIVQFNRAGNVKQNPFHPE